MEFTINNVISRTLSIVRERFWPLVGLWAIYLGFSIAASIVMGIVIAIAGVAGMGVASMGMDAGPAGLAGFGIGMIIFMIVFYAGYIYLFAAQAASYAALGAPYNAPNFGEALIRGFKAGLPLLGVGLLLAVIYIIASLLFTVLVAAVGSAAEILGAIMLLLVLPGLIYLACRMSLLVPIAANEQVRNPWRVIVRSWELSRGNVFKIFLILLLFTVLALIVVGLLFAPLGIFTGPGRVEEAIGSIIFLVVGLVVASVVLSILQGVMVAVMHGLLSGEMGEDLSEVFE